MRYTRDEDKSLQILNDGFLTVFQKIDTFKSEGSLEGWIRRSVYHSLSDFFRKENSLVRFIELGTQDQAQDVATPIDTLQFHDLVRLLDRLPERSATVFRLFAIEGYTHDEIAGMLQMSSGTSKWHLSKARERLRELLILDNGYAGSN